MKAAAVILIAVGLALGFLGNSAGTSQGLIGTTSAIFVFCGVVALIAGVFTASRRDAIQSVTEQYEAMTGPDGEAPPDVDLSQDPERMVSALGRLRDKGIITDTQFEEQKQRVTDQ